MPTRCSHTGRRTGQGGGVHERCAQQVGGQLGGVGGYGKFWAQVVRWRVATADERGFRRADEQVGDNGKITVEALNKDNAFLNFLSVAGTVVGPDMKPMKVPLVQTGPGTTTASSMRSSRELTFGPELHGANNQAG